MKLAKTKFQYVFSQTVFEILAEDPHELKLKQELLSMRSRTIEMVRNKSNLSKVLGANLKYFGIKQTKFEQGNLHLLKSVAFEGDGTPRSKGECLSVWKKEKDKWRIFRDVFQPEKK